jgi:ribonuclease BN (tRNA processing enzyme)
METTCYIFPWGNTLYIIDAGTGFRRIADLKGSLLKRDWDSYDQVTVLLTHYHLDHIMGLFWMRRIAGDKPVRIYGPGVEVYDKSAESIIGEIFRSPQSPHPFTGLHPDVQVYDFPMSGHVFDGLAISSKINRRHSDPSIAYRFNDLFAFVTDTPPEQETIDFVSGVHTMLHESWESSLDKFESPDDPIEKHINFAHTTEIGAGLIARGAGVENLYLIHHNPARSMADIDLDAANVSDLLGLSCHPARDLHEIRIPVTGNKNKPPH